MNEYLSYLMSFEFTSAIALLVYWTPLAICAVVYVIRGFEAYRADLKCRGGKYYTPSLTVGSIIWHAVLAITPCVNLFALVFDCLASVFRAIGKFLSVPLVPARPVKED
jgi:hypothetical protein